MFQSRGQLYWSVGGNKSQTRNKRENTVRTAHCTLVRYLPVVGATVEEVGDEVSTGAGVGKLVVGALVDDVGGAVATGDPVGASVTGAKVVGAIVTGASVGPAVGVPVTGEEVGSEVGVPVTGAAVVGASVTSTGDTEGNDENEGASEGAVSF